MPTFESLLSTSITLAKAAGSSQHIEELTDAYHTAMAELLERFLLAEIDRDQLLEAALTEIGDFNEVLGIEAEYAASF